MTTEQALKILEDKSIKSFTLQELKQIGRPIVNTAKKRVRALEEKDMVYSPAYQGYIVRKGMTVSLAGKDINKIRHEIYEAMQFLKAKTSTIKGVKASDKLMASLLGSSVSDSEARKMIWSAFDIIEKEIPQALQKFNYREVVERISETVNDNIYLTARDLIEPVMEKLGYINIDGVWMSKEQYIEADDWDDIW